jgi:hypothetical protein
MELEEYLAIPHVLVVESFARPDGEWLRRVSYPQLPDCALEAVDVLDLLEEIERLRARRIQELLDRGEPVPAPYPPLATQVEARRSWLKHEGQDL